MSETTQAPAPVKLEATSIDVGVVSAEKSLKVDSPKIQVNLCAWITFPGGITTTVRRTVEVDMSPHLTALREEAEGLAIEQRPTIPF